MKMEKLLIATHNAGKIKEFADMLAPRQNQVMASKDYNVPEPVESGTSFEENALIKARSAHRATGLAALADDSGLCIEALDNAPGVYSADWAQTPSGRDYTWAMHKIWEKMGHEENRSAKFIAVLALITENGHEKIYEGSIKGHITWPARGTEGHGYDPIFVPVGDTRTFAEMPSHEKNILSHRARALEKFLQDLECKAI
jgi:XTP/dITP diphosphohydrolase